MEQKNDSSTDPVGVVFNTYTCLCKDCNVEYQTTYLANRCGSCSFKAFAKENPELLKPRQISRWMGYKRFAYFFLLYVPLMMGINLIWGLEVEILASVVWGLGMFTPDIVRFLMRKF